MVIRRMWDQIFQSAGAALLFRRLMWWRAAPHELLKNGLLQIETLVNL